MADMSQEKSFAEELEAVSEALRTELDTSSCTLVHCYLYRLELAHNRELQSAKIENLNK